jgi:hypothetical protein
MTDPQIEAVRGDGARVGTIRATGSLRFHD